MLKRDCGFEFGDYRENWKLASRLQVRDSETLLREIYPPQMHSDPTFIVDRSGRIHQSKGHTGNLFETFNISQLNQIFDEESCEKILDFSGKKRIADNQTLECFSATLQKWFQIQFKPTLDKKHIYVWLIDIGHRKRLDLSLSATRRFSQEVIDNINVLIRNNDVYDRLADLMLKEGFVCVRRNAGRDESKRYQVKPGRFVEPGPSGAPTRGRLRRPSRTCPI